LPRACPTTARSREGNQRSKAAAHPRPCRSLFGCCDKRQRCRFSCLLERVQNDFSVLVGLSAHAWLAPTRMWNQVVRRTGRT
jgi:hypothetical protein